MKKVAAAALLFFCIIVFSATPPVLAHDGVTAEEASAGDMEDMRNFLLHLKRHRTRINTDDGQIEFRNALRTDNGVWRHGDTYVITVNREETGTSVQSGDIVFFHAKYPSAGSRSLRGIQIFQDLIEMVEEAGGEAVCVPDDRAGREDNHICAVEDSDATESGARNSFIQIVGFNHERDEAVLSKDIDPCPEFTRDELRSRGWLSADMVDDEESLVRYLEGVVEHVSEELSSEQQSGNGAQGRVSLVRMIQLLSPLMPCWRMRPWESGSIYFYIVTDTDKMYGIFNGNTPQLQDKTLRLRDDNGVEIAERILEEVRKQDDTPNRGFLTYLWDDPTVRGDEVICEEAGPVSGPFPEDKGVSCEAGNPIPGRSPGTSLKIGYFIRTNFGIGEPCDMGGTCYVVGSGIYPKPQAGEGGGGCAIASGSRNELEGAAFNLFLITAALFLATSRETRPGAKLLTWDLRARRKYRCRKG
jgi:hypothetical protein